MRKLEEAFRANYPGELLDSDTSPCTMVSSPAKPCAGFHGNSACQLGNTRRLW